jgi:hypothetical protein
MEKFQIAKYGLMQVTAVIYGILVTGAIVRIAHRVFEQPDLYPPISPALYRAQVFYHYGFCLFLIVIGWTVIAGYLSSSLSPWDFDPDNVALSGLVLAILLSLVSSFFGFGALASLFAPAV